ncbi:MAG: helix-turn-helix domain-containing protein [Clostridiales bacterium]|nr:helix-turn-helix domain-containing protein [Clostridiales bacterium]
MRDDRKKQHQRMEEALAYITGHYFEKITLAQIAGLMGYSPKAFNDAFTRCFGMSFSRFLRKYRLRRAAQEIRTTYIPLDTVKKRNGFQSKKFYESFREEFGVTPTQFKEWEKIPDMPVTPELNGHKLSMEYKKVEDVVIEGYPIRVSGREDVDLMDEAAYPFRHPSGNVDLHCAQKQWGVWWHDRQRGNTLCYLMGPQADSGEMVREKHVRLKLSGGDYAVFSVERGADYYNIADTAQELAWYVFRIWSVMNRKQTDKMGFTYEVFDKDRTYLYVPLLKGFGGIDFESEINGNLIEKLVQYVDEHILDPIDVDEITEYFGRSDFYCRDRFKACYRISLPDYIRRKRCYVLACGLKDGTVTEKELIRKYGYRSREQFDRTFRKEFDTDSENCENVTVELIDLQEYYDWNFRRLKWSERTLPGFSFTGKVIKSSGDREETDLDMPGLAEFWMENDFPEMKGSEYEGRTPKAALYRTQVTAVSKNARRKEKNDGIAPGEKDRKNQEKIIYQYVLGPVVKEATVKEKENIPANMQYVHVPGGKYMVFENKEADIEEESLAERIRLMVRCVDHIWIYNNWMRTDFQSRVSFFYYREGRLYYCVPLYGNPQGKEIQ